MSKPMQYLITWTWSKSFPYFSGCFKKYQPKYTLSAIWLVEGLLFSLIISSPSFSQIFYRQVKGPLKMIQILLGTILIWRPWKLSNFQDLPLPVHLYPKFFHHLDLGRPISNQILPPSPPLPPPHPLQMITNQSKENMIW